MLRRLSLENFKCYSSAQIDFAPLTVFSGRNAVGKSTVLQSLRLLRQVSLGQKDGDCVSIDGPLVRFGGVDGLVNSRLPRAQAKSVRVCAEGDERGECCDLRLERREEAVEDLRGIMRIAGVEPSSPEGVFGSEFVYLSADRISPETVLPYPEFDLRYLCNSMGNRGEFSAWYLGSNYQRQIPIQGFLHMGDSSSGKDALGQQVSLWMSDLGQELQVEPQLHDDVRSVGLRFALWEGDSFSKWYSPMNVGFGLTHCLPIFIAVLSRRPGALVLVENPESHLHPKAQVAMGRFLSKAASLGIQIVAETHSDHILNGVRLAVKDCVVRPVDVALNFMTTDAGDIRVVRPNLLASGAIDVWPRGFFDEYENVSLELM